VATHAITATYGGDSTFNASDNVASPYSQKLNKAATTMTLSSSANAAVVGQSVTVTATIGVVAPGAGTPTGTVAFDDSGATRGSGTLSTQAGVALVNATEQNVSSANLAVPRAHCGHKPWNIRHVDRMARRR
jgi:hypothetical protein